MLAPRTRALVGIAVVATLLALSALVERSRRGVELHLIALALVLAGPAFRRWLAGRGRASDAPLLLLALELTAFGGIVDYPFASWSLALAGGAALAGALLPLARREESPRAGRLEEGLVLAAAALATATASLKAREWLGLPLQLVALVLVAFETYAPEAPRTTLDAARRVTSFQLVTAAALVLGYERRLGAKLAGNALILLAFTAGLVAGALALRRLVRSSAPERAFLVRAGLLVFLLHVAVQGAGTALALGYILALLLALAHGVAEALGAPRAGRIATRTLLVLTTLVLVQPREDALEAGRSRGTIHFPDGRARAFYELAPPASWRGRGEPFVYVRLEGDMAALASARPVLTVDGRPLVLEVVRERDGFVRARFPDELLGAPSVRIAFGFERPTPTLGLRWETYYRGTLDRAPSAWSPDGSLPPPGPPLVPRRVGPVGAFFGKAPYEQPRVPLGPTWTLGERSPSDRPGEGERGRYAIDLWLMGEGHMVLAACY